MTHSEWHAAVFAQADEVRWQVCVSGKNIHHAKDFSSDSGTAYVE